MAAIPVTTSVVDVPLKAKILTVSESVAEAPARIVPVPRRPDVLARNGFRVVEQRTVSDGVGPVAAALVELSASFAGLVVTTGGPAFHPPISRLRQPALSSSGMLRAWLRRCAAPVPSGVSREVWPGRLGTASCSMFRDRLARGGRIDRGRGRCPGPCPRAPGRRQATLTPAQPGVGPMLSGRFGRNGPSARGNGRVRRIN